MIDKKTRIACVGNMNNNMFSIMRHLRSRGYNADLICSNETEHFSPDADTFDKTYLIHINQIDFFNINILESNRFKINKYFKIHRNK